jgi:phosphoglycolate phosphatase-like HAD superfamily hydrolase
VKETGQNAKLFLDFWGFILYNQYQKERDKGDRPMTYYFDMDGTLADFHGAYTSHADACRYDFIRNLAPFTANVETMRKAIADGHNCYILSKAANEEAKQAKIDWLAEFIPELTADKIIVIVGYGKKYEHMVEEGILIDDNVKETRQWEKAGHTAILLADKGAAITL